MDFDMIIGRRSSGKTRKLMLRAKEKNGIIVCRDPARMREKAYGYGIAGLDFISYNDYLTPQLDCSKIYYIDDIETFLKKINCGTKGFSATSED